MAVDSIRPLLDDVRDRGAEAIVAVTVERDGVDPRPIRVEANELAKALAELDPSLRKAIEAPGATVFEPMSPQQAHAFYLKDAENMEKMAKMVGVTKK